MTIVDTSCDADDLHDTVVESSSAVVIPPRHDWKELRPDGKHLQGAQSTRALLRHLKQFRRVATRYDQLLRNSKGFRRHRGHRHLAQMTVRSSPHYREVNPV